MEEILKEILEILKLKNPNKVEKITLSIQDASLYLGIGHEKIRELINKRDTDFPYFKVGARVSINKRALDKWLDKITEEHREL